MSMDSILLTYISYLENKIENKNKALADALLYIGFNAEKEFEIIDKLTEHIRAYTKVADRLYERLSVPRELVKIPKYHYLHKLSDKKELNSFFKKLSGNPEFANLVYDDGCVVALEK